MSGHSKWSQIKHKKALTDAKKGKIFSKLARLISVAAKEKGGNPEANPNLKMLIEKARSLNMPKENIERAIKRGSGEISGAAIEEFSYEAYGPSGIALIIEGITDNKNRTLSEIKNILTNYNGKLAQTGSVSYLFKKRGVLVIDSQKTNIIRADLEMLAIEADAEDLKWQNEILEIYTTVENLEAVKKTLQNKNILIESSSIDWMPQTELAINSPKEQEQIIRLFEALDSQDDVNEIYSNLRLSS